MKRKIFYNEVKLDRDGQVNIFVIENDLLPQHVSFYVRHLFLIKMKNRFLNNPTVSYFLC